MNNLKNQFLGFINTPPLFKKLNNLKQIELDINEIKNFVEVIDEIDLFLNHKKFTLVWLKNRKENRIQSFFVTW